MKQIINDLEQRGFYTSIQCRWHLQNNAHSTSLKEIMAYDSHLPVISIDYHLIEDFENNHPATCLQTHQNLSPDTTINPQPENISDSETSYFKIACSWFIQILLLASLFVIPTLLSATIHFQVALAYGVASLIGTIIIPMLIAQSLSKIANPALQALMTLLLTCVISYFTIPWLFGVPFITLPTIIIISLLAIMMPTIQFYIHLPNSFHFQPTKLLKSVASLFQTYFLITRQRTAPLSKLKVSLTWLIQTAAFILLLAGSPLYFGIISAKVSIGISIVCFISALIAPSIISTMVDVSQKDKMSEWARSLIKLIILCVIAYFATPIIFGVSFFTPTTGIIIGVLAFLLPIIQYFISQNPEKNDPIRIKRVGSARSMLANLVSHQATDTIMIDGKNYHYLDDKQQKCLIIYDPNNQYQRPTDIITSDQQPTQSLVPLDPLNGITITLSDQKPDQPIEAHDVSVTEFNNQKSKLYENLYKRQKVLKQNIQDNKHKRLALYFLSIACKVTFHILPALVLTLHLPSLIALIPFAYIYLDYLWWDLLFCYLTFGLWKAKYRALGLFWSHGWTIIWTIPMFFAFPISQIPLWIIGVGFGIMLLHIIITHQFWSQQDDQLNEISKLKHDILESITEQSLMNQSLIEPSVVLNNDHQDREQTSQLDYQSEDEPTVNQGICL
ncbi:hypothetical protein N9Y17_04935 [Gammaproteobacteria bacterium]|nr:hypothetical protein [Gammaproteobacteria bacterium]